MTKIKKRKFGNFFNTSRILPKCNVTNGTVKNGGGNVVEISSEIN